MGKGTEIKKATERITELQEELGNDPRNKRLKARLARVIKARRILRGQLVKGAIGKRARRAKEAVQAKAASARRHQRMNFAITLRPPTAPIQASNLRPGHRTWDFAPAR